MPPDNNDIQFDASALSKAIQSMGVSAQSAAESLHSLSSVFSNADMRQALEAWREMDIERQPVPTARSYVGASALPGLKFTVTDKMPPGVLAMMIGADGKPVVIREPVPPPPKFIIEMDD